MTTLAYSRLPWRRWWRHARHRFRNNRRSGIVKPWNALVLVLVGLDQLTKHILVTPEWAWHSSPASWKLYPLGGLLLFSPFLLHTQTRVAAAIAISGCLGNLGSEVLYDTNANPFFFQQGSVTHAFNLADVYLVVGFALTVVLTSTAIHRRQP